MSRPWVPGVLLAVLAVRGHSRPAGIGLVALSVAALAIVLAVDWPATDDSGSLAEIYELARAHVREGFYVELVAACVALPASVAALVLAGQSTRSTSLPRT